MKYDWKVRLHYNYVKLEVFLGLTLLEPNIIKRQFDFYGAMFLRDNKFMGLKAALLWDILYSFEKAVSKVIN